MFKNNEDEGYGPETNGVEDTLIGSSIKIEGDLVSNGSINVEGEVVGSLKTEKRLRVGEKAKVVADVKAQEAFISGTIQGNITVGGRLELSSTARVTGDIQSATLSIAAGAIFNGKSTMQEISSIKVEKKQEEVDEE
ncbi:MAG: hypothetical protein UT32_C0001G0079 [Parcubacteria group bacterium GW2011_GWC2_39_14]|nr:MAG: hypothetical protein UT32_C0001G0079 [Parcubacteria group bacterium GW2011_GWC2_39_14]KKR55503.1 MAG: hypothetical protein UT91_C0001G0078 [Parcubacteria group bacterium GW2011_GWA2_40_23]